MTSVCVIARNPEPVGRISHRGMSLSSSCMLFFIVIIILCGKVRYCIIRFYIHSGQTKNWKQSARKGRRTQTRTSERKKRPHLVLFSSLFWCLNVILYSPSCCSYDFLLWEKVDFAEYNYCKSTQLQWMELSSLKRMQKHQKGVIQFPHRTCFMFKII